jgi:hypothetical protein
LPTGCCPVTPSGQQADSTGASATSPIQRDVHGHLGKAQADGDRLGHVGMILDG